MATDSKTPVQKFRPYLSLAEIDALIALIESVAIPMPETTEAALMNARQALLKVQVTAQLSLRSAAYTTNPRISLIDKLGFGTDGETIQQPKRQNIETPDFDDMMASLEQLKQGE